MDADAENTPSREYRGLEPPFALHVDRSERLLRVRRESLFAMDPAAAMVEVMKPRTRRRPRKQRKLTQKPVGDPDGVMDIVELVQTHSSAVLRADEWIFKDYRQGCKPGCTPLHFVCMEGLGEYAELLVARGADLSATDISGCRPFCCAANAGSLWCVRAVLGDGLGNPTAYTKLLTLPAACGHEEIVRVLLAARAGVGARVDEGERGLRSAASRGQMTIVRMLVEAGVDPGAIVKGRSVIDSARISEHFEIAEWLTARLAEGVMTAEVGGRLGETGDADRPGSQADVALVRE